MTITWTVRQRLCNPVGMVTYHTSVSLPSPRTGATHRNIFAGVIALLLALIVVTPQSAGDVELGNAPELRVNEVKPPWLTCNNNRCGLSFGPPPVPLEGKGHSGAALSSSGDILDFPAKKVTLLSWMTPEEMNGIATRANDIWGYTSPMGREYAIVGLETGTAFVEITDPLNPTLVRLIAGARSIWRDMSVYGEYAYSVNERGDGMQIVDLTRIDKGKVRLRGTVTDLGLQTTHNIFINEDSGYAYLCGSNLARGGLVVVDLSDPLTPVIETTPWAVKYVHDVQVVSYEKGRYKGREIAFAFTEDTGVHIIDVTDKANIFTVSNVVYPNATYSHSGWLSDDRRFLYVNDELDELRDDDVSQATTYVLKVKDLEKARFVNSFTNGSTAIDHNSMVQNGTLFLASYRGGLRALSIKKNARKPKERGYFDTYPENDDIGFSGAWGVYAGFDSGNVIVSDIQRGLFVLRFP